MTPKVIATSVFALISVAFLLFSLRDKGPDLEKITPKTSSFECVFKKCEHKAELTSQEMVTLTQTEAKQSPDGSDWFYACPECGNFTYHVYQPPHENSEQP